MSGAPIGNQNAKKLNTAELRALAYESYCKHLSEGKPKKSWFFEHSDFTLTWQSMEQNIKENPIDFNPSKKKIAEARGLDYWFGVVADSARGKNTKANTATLQMLMRNKYGWDRKDSRPDEDENEHPSERPFTNLMDQIKDAQSSARKMEDSNNINE